MAVKARQKWTPTRRIWLAVYSARPPVMPHKFHGILLECIICMLEFQDYLASISCSNKCGYTRIQITYVILVHTMTRVTSLAPVEDRAWWSNNIKWISCYVINYTCPAYISVRIGKIDPYMGPRLESLTIIENNSVAILQVAHLEVGQTNLN